MAMATYTEAQIKGMTISELKAIAKDHFDPEDIKGLRKAQLQELLLDNPDVLDTEEDLDEIEDDEVDEVDEDEELDDEELDELDTITEEDLEEEEEDDEVDDTPQATEPKGKPTSTTPPEPNGDTLTAKQVATRIGTDAKTLRKFFRSPASTVEAVGQGGRYEFAKADLPKIKAEFEKWNSKKPTRVSRSTPKDEPRRRVVDDSDIEAEELDLDELDLDDDEE